MSSKLITIQMTEQDLAALVGAVTFAYEQMESAMLLARDPDFDQKRERLWRLTNELDKAGSTGPQKDGDK